MRIYSRQTSEGFKELLGYQCDSCDFFVAGEDLPPNFIITHGEHFCFECQVTCRCCKNIFSIKYSDTWMTKGFCENCQNSFKEMK